MSKSEALEKVGTVALVPGREQVERLVAAIQANMGGHPIDARSLPAIKMIGQGATLWSLTTLEGQRTVDAIECVVVQHNQRRGHWIQAYAEGASGPPDCYSDDGITGIGNPGGDCATCPLNQWGSAQPRSDGKESRGKGCAQRHQLFVLRPGDMLPHLISLPPTSLRAIATFLNMLTAHSKPFYEVVVELRIVKVKVNGYDTSVVDPRYKRDLDDAELESVRSYMAAIGGSLNQISYKDSYAADSAA